MTMTRDGADGHCAPASDRHDHAAVAAVFRALADPARLTIVHALADGAGGLADALVELTEDARARVELSRRGIEHAARYTWAEHARIVSQVYREVAGAKG